jgi:hypothetical protein
VLITDNYRALNAELHKCQPDYGMGISSKSYLPMVDELAKRLNATSILDYGCGKGELAMAMPHLLIEGYDPAVERYAAEPDPADLVVCMDVLEHIEPECLDASLDDIARCSLKGVFLTVATRPARRILSDGRNAHLIQQKVEWWWPLLASRFDVVMLSVKVGEFCFIGRRKDAEAMERMDAAIAADAVAHARRAVAA